MFWTIPAKRFVPGDYGRPYQPGAHKNNASQHYNLGWWQWQVMSRNTKIDITRGYRFEQGKFAIK